ncbi:D-3-phosphoglycerate dehydrogenase [Peteryoungia aggregata LMG 23059]|uniref:D-3-phosphoglycerate dehydrogenase n=1 Tax=Peteryoungia aggregata LMG 23059 TaxID=1368425 RepID=A0ABU0GF81_9HYPH|nr:NAD(P)-dependent oxidoreductase [Peteryoungia aggregata]MDQ0423280.1 D-3-phosphoglycerate dehydrogenase [Peteryoungia aggregata LMG 23059]
MKVVNAESLAYPAEARALLASLGEVVELDGERSLLIHEASDADILIVRLGNQIDNEVLSACRKLRVIVSATTGLNHVDVEEASRRGIVLISLKGDLAFLESVTATAEHAWGLLLSLARHQLASSRSVVEGEWDRDRFKGTQLSGKTIGILGLGRLGRMVAEYARAFRMNVLFCDPHVHGEVEGGRKVEMLDLFEMSDVVSVHASFSESNRRIVNADCFSRMKSTAFFINTARGELVDEQALLHALEQNRIAGAALDVLDAEAGKSHAWFHDHPLVRYSRLNENLVITPHIGGATAESMKNAEIHVVKKLMDFLSASGGSLPVQRSV